MPMPQTPPHCSRRAEQHEQEPKLRHVNWHHAGKPALALPATLHWRRWRGHVPFLWGATP